MTTASERLASRGGPELLGRELARRVERPLNVAEAAERGLDASGGRPAASAISAGLGVRPSASSPYGPYQAPQHPGMTLRVEEGSALVEDAGGLHGFSG